MFRRGFSEAYSGGGIKFKQNCTFMQCAFGDLRELRSIFASKRIWGKIKISCDHVTSRVIAVHS
jgi:hypothetical protein